MYDLYLCRLYARYNQAALQMKHKSKHESCFAAHTGTPCGECDAPTYGISLVILVSVF